VDQDRDAPQRAQRREALVAEERHDRVDLVRQALEPEAHEDFPDVRRDVVPDDAHGRRSTGASDPSQRPVLASAERPAVSRMALNDYAAMDEALAFLAPYGPDLRNGLTSHAPMAAE